MAHFICPSAWLGSGFSDLDHTTHEHCSLREWRTRTCVAESEVTHSPEMHGPAEGEDHGSIWPGEKSSGSSFVNALEVKSTEDT